MRFAQKKVVRLQAWQLGAGSDEEKRLIESGKIRLRPDGSYELFSQEATGGTGQIAEAGDYFKVDADGYPYPNKKEKFEATHRHAEGDWYIQESKPFPIWTRDEPEDERIRFLVSAGLLSFHPDTPERYFSAELWGTLETSPADSVVVFYDIQRDGEGRITHIDFNFVIKSEFDRTYEILAEQ